MGLQLAEAVRRLPAGWTGQFVAATSSTQDDARAAARQGAPDQSVFVADYQQQGRGRAGRAWLAQPGSALLLSVLLRQAADGLVPWRSTALASVAMAEAISTLQPTLWPHIKWPNDLLLDGRKVAGVLAEASSDGRDLAVVVGVGVNVNTTADELAPIPAPTTSLRIASGQMTDRGALLLEFVRRLDAWRQRPPADLQRAWQQRLWGRLQKLRLRDGAAELEVVVLGAEADGALRVRLSDGTERTTLTGELIL